MPDDSATRPAGSDSAARGRVAGHGQRQHHLAALPRHLVLAGLGAAGPGTQDRVDLVLQRTAPAGRQPQRVGPPVRRQPARPAPSPTAPIAKAAASAPTARSRWSSGHSLPGPADGAP